MLTLFTILQILVVEAALLKFGDEWWDGSSWLANYEEWPEQKEIIPTRESEKEATLIREVMCVAA